jgi:exo-1,4-beta-D-glucosaminidase
MEVLKSTEAKVLFVIADELKMEFSSTLPGGLWHTCQNTLRITGERMKTSNAFLAGILLFGAGFLPVSRAASNGSSLPPVTLSHGWYLQSSAHVSQDGRALSESGFTPSGWTSTSVPSTVLAALVDGKVYSDPYPGMNLRAIPGTTYPIGKNFSNLKMPDDSPFKPAWWYQTRFEIPSSFQGKQIWLHFDGINYRANVWMNGQKISGADQMVGMWRTFEFNVTAVAEPGKLNALAVEVSAPNADDLGVTWVDWNPAPPDKDMGLWRPVYLTASGPVAVRHPQVLTDLDLPSLEIAHLTVSAMLHNASRRAVKGNLTGQIGSVEFSQSVELAPNETRKVSFEPDKFPQLNFQKPQLWWPWQMGLPNLYDLHLEFESAGEVSDSAETQFGIREISADLNELGYRQFKVNGRNILILGAGWAPDMMLREMPEKTEEEIRYVRDMHLNTIRLEGKIEPDYFFNLCDRYGILVLSGWCCCDHWEKWKNWKPEDYTVAEYSLRDQILRIRNHPCLLDWLYGSDGPPPPRVEQMYLKVLKEYQWPAPYQSSATAKPTSVTGATGLKMTGPYEWVPPNYWLQDKKHGGAHGFNTETSPGPAVPPLASLKKMLPPDHLWPIDDTWNFHAGGGEFANLNVFTKALNEQYGEATSVEDYAQKSQLMAYVSERAMFEAYRRNKYVSTGVIQWMLNNAWPSMVWHLYDYYLRPAGGYFGTKKANEPLHVQYSYDDNSVAVVNSLPHSFQKVSVTAKVYDFNLVEKFSKQSRLDVEADSSTRVFEVPELEGISKTYFLRLTLEDAAGNMKSSNFYWLSTKPDVLDWKNTKWWYTPAESYTDFKMLKDLPAVQLEIRAKTRARGENNLTRVTVKNPGAHLALFVHLTLSKGPMGEEVLPVRWEDNYFELMPGEERVITATYSKADLEGASPSVAVDGWNVAGSTAEAGM